MLNNAKIQMWYCKVICDQTVLPDRSLFYRSKIVEKCQDSTTTCSIILGQKVLPVSLFSWEKCQKMPKWDFLE